MQAGLFINSLAYAYSLSFSAFRHLPAHTLRSDQINCLCFSTLSEQSFYSDEGSFGSEPAQLNSVSRDLAELLIVLDCVI